MKKIIQINGMKCEHCTSRVEEALKKIANVKSVKVNLAKKEAIIHGFNLCEKGIILMRADKKQITRLLNTAKGQIIGIIKMIDDDKYCIDISNQLLAVEAIIKKANQEVIRAHLEGCVKEAIANGEDSHQKINEIMQTITKMSK